MEQDKLQTVIFDNNTLSVLIQNTYSLLMSKDSQIEKTLEAYDTTEASIAQKVMLGEIVTKLTDTSIKNHDNMIKLLGVIQKIVAPAGKIEPEDNSIKRELEDLKKELEADEFAELLLRK